MFKNFFNHPIRALYQGVRYAALKSKVLKLRIVRKDGETYRGSKRELNVKINDLNPAHNRCPIFLRKSRTKVTDTKVWPSEHLVI